MNKIAILGIILVTTVSVHSAAIETIVHTARTTADAGDFAAACSLLERELVKTDAPDAKHTLEWELGRLALIRRDYSQTRTMVVETIRKLVPDFKDDEFDRWEREGRFDSRLIDGERRYLGPSARNLLFRYEDIRDRTEWSHSEYQDCLLQEATSCPPLANHEGLNFVKPRRFRLRMTDTPDAKALPATGLVRCWLPYPRAFPFQVDIKLIAASPDPKWLAQPEETQRTIYFESPVRSGLEFSVEYSYLAYARVCRIDPERVTADIPSELRIYTEECPPHVVFTDKIRGLSKEIVGEETNPARIVKQIYDWQATHLKYSYAPEYATLDNISDWVFERRYGDCGQMALFYITLCRLNGIPARWQSGWMLHPGNENLHDWCEIYLAPYGWVPVDPNMGVTAWNSRQYTPEEKSAVMEFYFGSLDHWRLAANAGHGCAHTPPKTSWRTDPVDSQRGELEADGHTIPFGRFSYRLEILEQTLIEEE